jgi:hypothetical protein
MHFSLCHPNEHKFAAGRFLIGGLNAYKLNHVAKEKELIFVQNIL